MYRAYDDPNRIVRVGLPGMADSGMIVPVKITPEMVGQTVGVAVQVEFKSGMGKQSEKQENWQKAVTQAGGIYQVIRSVGEFRVFLDEILKGK